MTTDIGDVRKLGIFSTGRILLVRFNLTASKSSIRDQSKFNIIIKALLHHKTRGKSFEVSYKIHVKIKDEKLEKRVK